MAGLTEEQAKAHITKLLAAMAAAGGSDLFIANDFPPSMKVHGGMKPMTTQKLTGDVTRDAGARDDERAPARGVRQRDGVQLRDLDSRHVAASASTSSCSSRA